MDISAGRQARVYIRIPAILKPSMYVYLYISPLPLAGLWLPFFACTRKIAYMHVFLVDYTRPSCTHAYVLEYLRAGQHTNVFIQ